MKYLQRYFSLFESKKTEQEGLNILNAANIENANNIISKIKEIDTSNNQVNIPVIAAFYAGGVINLNNLKTGFDTYNDLLKRNRLTVATLIKGKKLQVKIADKLFDNDEAGFIKFREYVDGKKPATNSPVSKKTVAITDIKDTPIWSGDNIFIYEANDIVKCIKYTQGGLTGRSYSFCIGQYGSGNMFNSYRDLYSSTFYFIIDKNRELSDPLHIVVYDHQQHEILLTDANNTTGNIAMYGSDVNSYNNYLKTKGVPVDKILVNHPKTGKEIEEERLLKNANEDLDWFIRLPIELKSRYIGRGHMLTNEQFDYLIG